MAIELLLEPEIDTALLAERFASLGTFDMAMLCCLLAAAIYFAFEGFVSDFSRDEMRQSLGSVVSEDSRWGEDYRYYSVEYRSECGTMQVIRNVKHPFRNLIIGEQVSVHYPLSAPEKGRVPFGPVTQTTATLFKVGAMLVLSYILVINS